MIGKKSSSKPSDSSAPDRPRSRINWKSFAITSVIVVSSTLIGVLFYAQYGLFVNSPEVSNEHEAQDAQPKDIQEKPESDIDTINKEETSEDHNPDKQAPKQNDTTTNDKKSSARSSSPAETKDSKVQSSTSQAESCDNDAKLRADKNYKNSLHNENKIHDQNLKNIGPISRILGILPIIKDKVEQENLRHEHAIDKIEAKYKGRLESYGCQVSE